MGSWQDYQRAADHSSVIPHVSRSAARPAYLWGKGTSVLGMKLRLCRDFGVPYGLVAPQGPYPCAPDVFGISVARAPGNENSSLVQYCSGVENRVFENSHHFRAKNNTIIPRRYFRAGLNCTENWKTCVCVLESIELCRHFAPIPTF